jgi:DNA replication and repair protein RecF
MFGKTNIGIHHDDIIFKLNDKVIKDYGSEGQQKNAVISYKFAVLNIFRELKGSYPIFILDDLFSELDKSKINNILNIINDDVQTFITTTEIDKVNKHIVDKSKLIEISNGIIREVNNCEGRI